MKILKIDSEEVKRGKDLFFEKGDLVALELYEKL